MAVYDDLIDKAKLARFHDNLKQKGLPLNDRLNMLRKLLALAMGKGV